MTDEIKSIARRHLATDGANLSLRAVARDLGVVSSAIYRYFPSRDDLLTALIIDAYNALGDAVESAEAAVERADLTGRFLAMCRAVRGWAVANPHEYALIYGSPVPGYAAPRDTVAAAIRPIGVLGRILRDGTAAGILPADPGEITGPVREDLCRLRDAIAPGVPLPALSRAVGAWLQLFGFVSFELFGQFANTVEAPEPLLDAQMRAQAAYIGLP